jgi:hypothetical protein
MTHGVDAAMEPMQAPHPQTPRDRLLPNPKREQLSPRNHPMLAPRYLGNLQILRASLRFCVLEMHWSRLGGHVPGG